MKTKKYFRVVNYRTDKINDYYFQISTDGGNRWLDDCMFNCYDISKQIGNVFIHESAIWKINELNELGYEFIGVYSSKSIDGFELW